VNSNTVSVYCMRILTRNSNTNNVTNDLTVDCWSGVIDLTVTVCLV